MGAGAVMLSGGLMLAGFASLFLLRARVPATVEVVAGAGAP
jgi:hypothetical protein